LFSTQVLLENSTNSHILGNEPCSGD